MQEGEERFSTNFYVLKDILVTSLPNNTVLLDNVVCKDVSVLKRFWLFNPGISPVTTKIATSLSSEIVRFQVENENLPVVVPNPEALQDEPHLQSDDFNPVSLFLLCLKITNAAAERTGVHGRNYHSTTDNATNYFMF
jgi:hypothetical protein